MKKNLFTITLVCLMIANMMAQVPQSINFQAIARDAQGNVMVNTNIMIRLSVVDSATGGNIVYQELRALQTNAYGSFTFQIGLNPDFVTVGVFKNIDWATGCKHLKIDYDPTNTFNWNLTLGTIGFSTVPFAFTASSVTGIITTGANNGDVLKYNSATKKWEPGTDNTGATIPAGTILPFAGSTVPTGWMLCDGSAINRVTYSALFTVIGNSWGAGDYTSTFNLPDMRGVFLRGVDGSAGNDPDKTTRTSLHAGGNTGNNVGSFQLDEFASHNHAGTTSTAGSHAHSINDPTHSHRERIGNNKPGSLTWINASPSTDWSQDGPSSFDTNPSTTGITINSDGIHSHTISSDGGNETRPKNVYVNYIIKY